MSAHLAARLCTFAFSAGAFAWACAQPAIHIDFAHAAPARHPSHAAAERFAELVRERSGGAIAVRVQALGEQADERRLLDATRTGALQMSVVGTAALAGFEPAMQLFDLPYVMPTYKVAYAVLDGEIGAQVARDLPAKGVRNLAYWENDYRQLSNSRRPVTSVDEVQGLTIGVPSTPVLIGWVQTLDATPAPIERERLYAALQQRTVDGQDNGIFLTYANKYYQVQPYFTLTQHVYAPMALLINERFFQALSGPQRELVRQAAIEARDFQRRLSAELRAARLEEMKRAGLKVSELSPQARQLFRQRARLVYGKLRPQDRELLQRMLAVE